MLLLGVALADPTLNGSVLAGTPHHTDGVVPLGPQGVWCNTTPTIPAVRLPISSSDPSSGPCLSVWHGSLGCATVPHTVQWPLASGAGSHPGVCRGITSCLGWGGLGRTLPSTVVVSHLPWVDLSFILQLWPSNTLAAVSRRPMRGLTHNCSGLALSAGAAQ